MRSLVAILLSALSAAAWSGDCPVTIGTDGPYDSDWPDANTWYGSKLMAVMLPQDGVWPLTRPGGRIAVKLFWFLDGFRPGMEDEFLFSIRRIGDGPDDAAADRVTNAGGESLGAWTALVGLHFLSEGCWEVWGSFRGQSLRFVAETRASKTGAARKQ